MKKLYNLEPIKQSPRKDNCGVLRYSRKQLLMFKKKIGLPMGAKENISIPMWIFKKRGFQIACLRGLFDTDGCVCLQKKYREDL